MSDSGVCASSLLSSPPRSPVLHTCHRLEARRIVGRFSPCFQCRSVSSDFQHRRKRCYPDVDFRGRSLCRVASPQFEVSKARDTVSIREALVPAYRREQAFELGGCTVQHGRQHFREEHVAAFGDDAGRKVQMIVDGIHHANTRSHSYASKMHERTQPAHAFFAPQNDVISTGFHEIRVACKKIQNNVLSCLAVVGITTMRLQFITLSLNLISNDKRMTKKDLNDTMDVTAGRTRIRVRAILAQLTGRLSDTPPL